MLFNKCVNALIAALTVSYSAAAPTEERSSGHPRLKNGMTWANRAWGEGRDKDSYSGKQAIDVDLFDTSKEKIKEYQDEGLLVLCYVNVGATESWRADYKDNEDKFDSVKGKSVDGWKNEHWFDIVNELPKVKKIIERRFKLAAEKGCDAIEADNIDCYQNDCVSGAGSSTKKKAQIDYSKWQSKLAHKLGMAIGMKNALDLIPTLEKYYDFAMNEQCVQYGECSHLKKFKDANKAVFGAEYHESESKIKSASKKYGMKVKNEKDGKWKNMW